jgi:HlyD family secretion protein
MNERVMPDLSDRGARRQDVSPAGVVVPASAVRSAKRLWLIGAAVVLLVVGAATGAWWLLGTSNSVEYTTMPVTRGVVSRGVTATGAVNPELTIIVGTYVSGVIQQLHCDYNTQVKKGHVCAEIDPRPYQSVVDQTKANLAVAKAQLEKDKAQFNYAKSVLDRASRLVQTNAVSQDAFENATSNYQQARAQIEFDEATIQQRQATLDAAQVNLDYTRIVSPVDGTVVSRNVTMGQTVAASFQTPTLFLIATDLTKMKVDVNVSESDIGNIEVGDKATFTVDAFARRVFRGNVSQVRQSPQTVQNVVTYDVVVDVDNSDLALKPGMTATSRLIVDERSDVVRVPNQALRYRPGGARAPNGPSATRARDRVQVWVQRGKEVAPVDIVTGLQDDNFIEVVSGELNPGDQVIVAERAASGGSPTALRLRF